MGGNKKAISKWPEFGMDLKTRALSITVNGVEYTIKGFIHTHPNTGVNPETGMTWLEPPSTDGSPANAPTDDYRLSVYGVPNYVISANHVYQATIANGRKVPVIKGSKSDLVNCSLAL